MRDGAMSLILHVSPKSADLEGMSVLRGRCVCVWGGALLNLSIRAGRAETRHFKTLKEILKLQRINTFAKLHCNLTKVFEGCAPLLKIPLLGWVRGNATCRKF